MSSMSVNMRVRARSKPASSARPARSFSSMRRAIGTSPSAPSPTVKWTQWPGPKHALAKLQMLEVPVLFMPI